MSMEMTTELSLNLFRCCEKEMDSAAGNTSIFEEITKEPEKDLSRESDDADAMDGVLESLTSISGQV